MQFFWHFCQKQGGNKDLYIQEEIRNVYSMHKICIGVYKRIFIGIYNKYVQETKIEF